LINFSGHGTFVALLCATPDYMAFSNSLHLESFSQKAINPPPFNHQAGYPFLHIFVEKSGEKRHFRKTDRNKTNRRTGRYFTENIQSDYSISLLE
jgi:hypothetical protein